MMSFKILNKIYISACRTKISLIRDFNEKFGKEEQSIIDEDPNILNEIRLQNIIPKLKDIINPYYCFLKNDNFSIKKSNC